MNATTKLLPGTRVQVFGTPKSGTVQEGIPSYPDQVLVEFDDWTDIGAIHTYPLSELVVIED